MASYQEILHSSSYEYLSEIILLHYKAQQDFSSGLELLGSFVRWTLAAA